LKSPEAREVSEIVTRRFAGDDDVGGRSGSRDRAVVVEEIDAAGIRWNTINCSDSEVGLSIGIEVTGSIRELTEITHSLRR
jgi:hypothetical protein